MSGQGSRIARQQALRALACDQEGYFTAAQAGALGFSSKHFARFVATGSWARERHGIYRLPDVQPQRPGLAELHLWLLWTASRKTHQIRGAVGYETALVVYGLSDLQMDKVHLVVPKGFRVSQVPREVRLHVTEHASSAIGKRDGLRVVKPLPTLVDLLDEGRVSEEHIEAALSDGLRKGVITPEDFAAIPQGAAHNKLHVWLREMRR